MKKGFILFLLFLVAGCAKFHDHLPVVRVGNRVVDLKEFNTNFYIDLLVHKKNKINEQEVNDFLNNTINFELKLSDAYAMHLEKDSVVLAEREKKAKELFPNYVLEKVIIPKVINENDYKHRYYCKNTEIKAEQIYIPLSKDDTANQKNQDLLDSLRSLIVHGADFAKLANKYSQDKMSAGRGGNMGFVRWDDKSFDKEFYNTLFKMNKDELSQVIVTGTGMHLVRKIEERSLPALPYEMERRKIRQDFFGEYGAELNKQYREFIDDLGKKYPGDLNKENITYFADRAAAINDSLRKIHATMDTPEAIEQVESDRVLAKYGDEKFTIRDFMNEVHFAFNHLNPEKLTLEKISGTVEQYVVRNRIIKYGYDKRMNHDKMYLHQLKTNMNKFIVDQYEQQVLKNKVTQEEQEDEYEANWQKYNKLHIPYHALTGRQKLDIKNYLVNIREEELLKTLREKYPVIVYKENLEF